MGRIIEAEGTARAVSRAGTQVASGPPLFFQKLNPHAIIPTRAHEMDAGLDLSAIDDFVLQPAEQRVVPTGLAVAIPRGYVGLVCPRSGLAAKHSITVVNAPGIIDAGYRGELQVILFNMGTEYVEIKAGDRIAQLVITPIVEAAPLEVDKLPSSVRGDGGLGSSGR